jgi:hypothetical protein
VNIASKSKIVLIHKISSVFQWFLPTEGARFVALEPKITGLEGFPLFLHY